MFIHEAIYDLDVLARENMHIHTVNSRCGRRNMFVPDIIRMAEEAGLERIAITDHIHPFETDKLGLIEGVRKEVESIDTKVKVYVGAELSAYGIGKYVESEEFNKTLDYRLFSYNHYHQDDWDFPEERTARGFWELACNVLKKLFEDKRADCVAHPFKSDTVAEYLIDEGKSVEPSLANVMSDNELGDLLELGYKNEVAWELNAIGVFQDPVFYRRMFNLGKEIGVVFNFGTDAHNLERVPTKDEIERIKEILG